MQEEEATWKSYASELLLCVEYLVLLKCPKLFWEQGNELKLESQFDSYSWKLVQWESICLLCALLHELILSQLGVCVFQLSTIRKIHS